MSFYEELSFGCYCEIDNRINEKFDFANFGKNTEGVTPDEKYQDFMTSKL